jgi:hypothetical protein
LPWQDDEKDNGRFKIEGRGQEGQGAGGIADPCRALDDAGKKEAGNREKNQACFHGRYAHRLYVLGDFGGGLGLRVFGR